MRGAGLSLALVLLLTGCAPGESARGVECQAFDAVDRNAPSPRLNDEPDEELLETIWKRWADAEPQLVWRSANPDATIRLSSAPGMELHPTHREVVARRAGGRWEVHARSGGTAYPHIDWDDWAEKPLSPRGTARLNALLSNPCLWNAPPFLNAIVKLKNGRHDFRPDGPSTMYAITNGAKHWGGWQLSWTVGAPGEMRNLLLAEAFGLEDYPVDQIDPVGQLNETLELKPPAETTRP